MSDKFEERVYKDGKKDGDDVDKALLEDLERRIKESVDYEGIPKISQPVMDQINEALGGEHMPVGTVLVTDGNGGWMPDEGYLFNGIRGHQDEIDSLRARIEALEPPPAE